MKKEQKPTIEEILNFNFSEELDLNLLPQEEQDKFNENLYGSLIERILKRTTENFSESEQEEILSEIENGSDMEKVFNLIAEKNENFLEELGEEYLEFKSEIYDLLKN